MLGICWLVKKLPNYELFLTNSSPEAFTNIWQFTLYNCWAYNYLPTVLVKSGWELVTQYCWIILTVFSFTLGKISWAMKLGWSKIMRKILPYRSLPNSG